MNTYKYALSTSFVNLRPGKRRTRYDILMCLENLPSQISFPIGGQRVTCRGLNLTNSLGQIKLTNSLGKQQLELWTPT